MHVLMSAADQMFNAIRPDMTSRMPQYKGDLELINHSAGSLTSQAYHKLEVIRNANLADAAEKASLAADWLGGLKYPQDRLNAAWRLELGGPFPRQRRRHRYAARLRVHLERRYDCDEPVRDSA